MLGIKRNKYISRPLEGHSGETDKLPLFTAPWDQGSDRDIANVVREAVAVCVLPISLVKVCTAKRPSVVCV